MFLPDILALVSLHRANRLQELGLDLVCEVDSETLELPEDIDIQEVNPVIDPEVSEVVVCEGLCG